VKFFRYVVLGGAALLAGCAGNSTNIASDAPPEPNPNQAQIVFIRDSSVGKAVQASVYDVTTPETQFIGIVANKAQVSYLSPGGKRTFMVVSDTAEFMEADLTTGNLYYAMVIPRVDDSTVRFSLWPVSQDATAPYNLKSNDFVTWMADTNWVPTSPASVSWYQANKADIEAKRQKYWAEWLKKSPGDTRPHFLMPGDGQLL
jgi:hypothetical protein